MKKIIFAAAAVIVVIICVCAAVSFFIVSKSVKLEGKYSNVDMGTGGILEFDGKNVTATYMSAGDTVYSVSGVYRTDNGNIIMNFNGNTDGINVFEGTHLFDVGDGYIMLDGVKYKKTE